MLGRFVALLNHCVAPGGTCSAHPGTRSAGEHMLVSISTPAGTALIGFTQRHANGRADLLAAIAAGGCFASVEVLTARECLSVRAFALPENVCCHASTAIRCTRAAC